MGGGEKKDVGVARGDMTGEKNRRGRRGRRERGKQEGRDGGGRVGVSQCEEKRISEVGQEKRARGGGSLSERL